jgi:hypothetical protein
MWDLIFENKPTALAILNKELVRLRDLADTLSFRMDPSLQLVLEQIRVLQNELVVLARTSV